MAVVIRLQGLPVVAGSADIRRFFSGLNIPNGGVHIIGGEKGEAFVIFATDEDARQAMSHSGRFIKDSSIKLFLSSKTEMQHIIEVSRKRFDRGGRETITGCRRTGTNLGASGVGDLSNLVEAIKKGIKKSRYGSVDILGDKFHSGGSQNSHPNLAESNYDNSGEDTESLYLFVRGMPYSATEDDVHAFFSGLKIDRVIMIKNEEGLQNGDGVVKFATLSDAIKGLQRNRKFMGSRFLEVYSSNEVLWMKHGGRVDKHVDRHFDNDKDPFSSGREHSSRRESSYYASRKYSPSRSPNKVMEHSHSRSPRRAIAHAHSRSPPRRAMARSYSRSPPRRAMPRSHSRSPPRRGMPRSHSRLSPRRAMEDFRSRSPKRAMEDSRSRSPRKAMKDSRSRTPRRAMTDFRSRSPRRAMARSRSRSPRRTVPHSRSKSPRKRSMAHSHSRSPRRDMAQSSQSGSSQSHLHHSKEYYIHVKNLSVVTEKRDLRRVFRNLELSNRDITFFLHENKKDAFVVFKSEREYKMALRYDKKSFLDNQLHIVPITKKDMSQILKSSEIESSPEKNPQVKEKRTQDGFSGPKTCVYIRNFPFDVTNVEVQKFFAGFNIDNSNIHLLYDDNGIGLGEALVKFGSEAQAQEAETLNRRRFLGTEVLLRCIPEEQMKEFGINVSSNKMQDHLNDRREHFRPVDSQEPAMQGNIKYPLYKQQSDNFISSSEGFRGPPPFPEFDGSGISGGFPDSHYLHHSNFPGCADGITLIRLNNVPFQASPNEILDFFHGYKIIPESLYIQNNKYGMPSGEAILALVNYGEAMAAINELNDRPFGQGKVKLSFV